MKIPTKVVVIIISLTLLGLGIYGTTYLDQSFDASILGRDGSYQKKFTQEKRKYFSEETEVSVVTTGELNYSSPTIQQSYLELASVAKRNKYYQNFSSNWLENFLEWTSANKLNNSGQSFPVNLMAFLRAPANMHYMKDLKFASDNKTIIASRIIVKTINNGHSTFRKNAMLSLRTDLDNFKAITAFPVALLFIYFEQFAVILTDTIRNLVVSGSAVFIVTLPYLIHPGATFLVVFSFTGLVFELLGLMYIWNVSLNSISMIVIIMAIGFSVDYSAHIAHAFIISPADRPEDRMVEALSTMGTSVAVGGKYRIQNLWSHFVVLNLPFVCQSISACIKLNRPW